MAWNDNDEATWRALTERRESNKREVGKVHFVQQLRALADAVERGEQECGEVDIEYIRADRYFGHEWPGAVIGRKITVMLKTPNDQAKRTTKAQSAVGGPLDPPVRPHPPEASD